MILEGFFKSGYVAEKKKCISEDNENIVNNLFLKWIENLLITYNEIILIVQNQNKLKMLQKNRDEAKEAQKSCWECAGKGSEKAWQADSKTKVENH